MSSAPFIGFSAMFGPLVGAIIFVLATWAYEGIPRDGGSPATLLVFGKAILFVAMFAYPLAILPAAISAYLCLRFGAATLDGRINYISTIAIAFAVCFVYGAIIILLMVLTQNQGAPRVSAELFKVSGSFALIGAVSALICSFIIQSLVRRFAPKAHRPDNERVGDVQ